MFADLSDSRPSAERYVHIPHSEYVAYFEIYDSLNGLQDDVAVLRAMDKEYVRIRNEKLALRKSVGTK